MLTNTNFITPLIPFVSTMLLNGKLFLFLSKYFFFILYFTIITFLYNINRFRMEVHYHFFFGTDERNSNVNLMNNERSANVRMRINGRT